MLWPPNLVAGAESGLCNQLLALIGYAIKANYTRARALVLPNLTSHTANGTQQPFALLFDGAALAASLWSRARIRVWVCDPPVGCARHGPSLARAPALAGEAAEAFERNVSWEERGTYLHGGVSIGWADFEYMLEIEHMEDC